MDDAFADDAVFGAFHIDLDDVGIAGEDGILESAAGVIGDLLTEEVVCLVCDERAVVENGFGLEMDVDGADGIGDGNFTVVGGGEEFEAAVFDGDIFGLGLIDISHFPSAD